jgi:hypothetical protein
LLWAELVSLLGGGLCEGAGGEAACGGLGDEFHLGQIDVETGARVAEGLADDDFAPVPGELGDAVGGVGGERS